jgi:hypothetical protein
MDKKRKQEIIDHIFKSACGYGMAESNGIQSKFADDGSYMPNKTGGTVEGGKKAFEKCMNAIPDEYFEDFLYTLYRVAEKRGADGFDC